MKFVKMNHNATLPSRATPGSAGYDLCAIADTVITAGTHKLIPTGIGWTDVPHCVVGLIWPKSGPSYKLGADVLGGVIDSDYDIRDIGVIIDLAGRTEDMVIKAGDSIAQMVIQPYLTVDNEVTPRSVRTGGYGSTGK